VFDRWFDSTRWWWCALSGLLLVASFPPFACATCGWIALVPAWWVITRSERTRRQPIRHGYLIGLLYFGGTFWWISNVTAIGTFFLVLYLALYPAVWFLFVARLVARREGELHILFQAGGAAALWVTLEWWRSWFLTGFNWNELGVSQAPSIVFRQLAAFGGVHLISFVLVMVNILWAEGVLGLVKTFQEKRVIRASFPFAAALFIVAVCFALGWHHLLRHRGETLRPSLNFACVQPNIPQIPPGAGGTEAEFEHREDEALQSTQKLSLTAIAGHPDLLIWPEAMIDEGVFQDRPLNEAVHDICLAYNGYFLLGSQDFDLHGRKLYNCAYLFTPHGDQYEYYRKTRLVILGEYLPFGDKFPWLRKVIGIGIDFTPGDGPRKFVMEKPAVSFAPLICFEDTIGDLARQFVLAGANLLVNVTNDGWFLHSAGSRQHLASAVFRCVETRLPMVRAANTGVTCFINEFGKVTQMLVDENGSPFTEGTLTGQVAIVANPELTFYTRHGELLAHACVGVTVLALAFVAVRSVARRKL